MSPGISPSSGSSGLLAGWATGSKGALRPEFEKTSLPSAAVTWIPCVPSETGVTGRSWAWRVNGKPQRSAALLTRIILVVVFFISTTIYSGLVQQLSHDIVHSL